MVGRERAEYDTKELKELTDRHEVVRNLRNELQAAQTKIRKLDEQKQEMAKRLHNAS